MVRSCGDIEAAHAAAALTASAPIGVGAVAGDAGEKIH
jgi:hypothetical protein